MAARLTIFLIAISLGQADDARAQHEGHSMPGASAPAASNPGCAEGGRKALGIVEAATARLETARRANSEAEMRAAVSDLQTTVAAAQAELFTCRAAVPDPPVSAMPPGAMAGMDHSKMNTGSATPKPDATGVAAGGEGKLPVTMAERIADPACPDNLGQAAAPRAVFQRKVYYFCSTGARDEFRRDPAVYLKKHPR